MPRIKKAKVKEEKKIIEPENIDTIEPAVEPEQPVVEKVEPVAEKKSYVVVLGTPGFYVIKLEDGSMRTIQESNNYKRGDIVQL